LLVVLVVLECAGRLRSAKPLAVRSLSLPLSFAVIGSNSRPLPLRLRPLSASMSVEEDEEGNPLEVVFSRSNPRVASKFGVLISESVLGNSMAAGPNALTCALREVKDAGDCPRDGMRDWGGAELKSSSGALSASSSSTRDPLSL
jgi:hypothetical protein